MAKCNQLTPLPFKGLIGQQMLRLRRLHTDDNDEEHAGVETKMNTVFVWRNAITHYTFTDYDRAKTNPNEGCDRCPVSYTHLTLPTIYSV